MAYDSYRDPPGVYEPGDGNGATNSNANTNSFPDERPYVPSSYHPPYPSQYMSDQVQMPQPRMPSPSFQGPAPISSTGGRIDDAVASAVNQADHTNTFSPELIQQVTASVIQQLHAYGLGSAQGGQQQQPQQPPPPPQSVPPALDNTYYKPPPSAQYSKSQSPEIRELKSAHTVPLEARDSQPRPSPDKADSIRVEARPVISDRAPASSELTTLERIWGILFEDGKPTPRLGQLLRGIAVHLIEDYEPGNTLVVIPEKMQKYYADTKVSTDTYPFHDIFDDQASSISRIYRDIEAEHHLVQGPLNLNARPDKPGLTPRGFERWFTVMILANPDREFARLKKTVLDMPISNPDDKKERFPKELPRRLFPKSADLKLLEKLEASIITHSEVDLPQSPPSERSKSPIRRVPVEKSPSQVPTVTERPPPPPPVQEREPQTYSSSSTAVVDDDEEETISPRPIERERKPYSAQPGGGKFYDDGADQPSKNETSKGKDFLTSPITATHRQSHTYGQDAPHLRAGSQSTTTTSGGGYNSHTHHGTISSKSGRTRSSSVGVGGPGDYRHSEPDLNSFDSDYLGSGSGGHYRTSSTAGDGYDDNRRYRDHDRDDARDYEFIRERERDRERRHHDHLNSRATWSDEDYYRGLLGGQGSGSVGGHEYKYR